MRILLDTHALLWFVWDDARLSGTARDRMMDPDAELFFSVASAWEMVIKTTTGKLQLGADVETFLEAALVNNRIATLPIEFRHVITTGALPQHHRDPFDRIIIAQAVSERLSIITGDPEFLKYAVPLIW